jgi:hypothetical protein
MSMLALSCGNVLSASTVAFAKNGRNESLTPLAGLEVALGPVAQRRDSRDVDLDDRGQLRRGLQRLAHALRDDPRSRDIFSVVPRSGDTTGAGALAIAPGLPGLGAGERGSVDGNRLGALAVPGGRRGLLGRPGLRRLEDVLLADAPADAGAGERAQVDAVLAASLRTSGVT